jgi:hypothetical protein
LGGVKVFNVLMMAPPKKSTGEDAAKGLQALASGTEKAKHPGAIIA